MIIEITELKRQNDYRNKKNPKDKIIIEIT